MGPNDTFDTVGQQYRRGTLWVSIIIAFVLIVMEMRRIIYYRLRYLMMFFNWVSLAANALSFILSLNTLKNNLRGPSQIAALTVLILWLNFLQQCRIYRSIGIYANVILGSAWGIRSFVIILGFLLIAFSQALWTLLGIFSSADLGGNPAYFSDYDQSLKYLFYGLGGDTSGFDSYKDVPNNWAGDLIRSLFNLITVVFILNILIALLNFEFSKALDKSERSWRLQFAQIITDVEIFLMQPPERRNVENFPPLLFFEVKPDTIRRWNTRKEAHT